MESIQFRVAERLCAWTGWDRQQRLLRIQLQGRQSRDRRVDAIFSRVGWARDAIESKEPDHASGSLTAGGNPSIPCSLPTNRVGTPG